MTQQAEGSEELQVDPVTAPLDIDQASLDAAQAGEPAPPQFVTVEKFEQMMGAITRLQNHTSGLESRIDKGITGLGANLQELTAAAAKKELERREQELLSSIEDPDERARMETMLELQTLRNPQQPIQQVLEQPAAQTLQQTEAEQWAQVRQFVVNSGVHPDNPAVNYNVLVDPSKTADQRQAAFMQSLVAAGNPTGQQPPIANGSQQAPAQQAQSPQRPAGPVGNTGYRNVNDVYDAWISGRIPTTDEGKAEYRRELAKFGETP